MRTTLMLSALVLGLAMLAIGCADATTRDDVADAREDLQEERQDTAEAMREGQESVADARRDAQPYTVNKPVTSDDAAESRQEIAEAQHEANQEIAQQRQEERGAAADLRATQQQFQATQARDAFVKNAEQKLAEIQVQINQLKENADAADDEAKQALNQRLETLENQHELAAEALEELKSAEIAQWQTHQEPVRVALNELTTSVNNVR